MILAIYGSPRRQGNSSLLLDKAVEGALEAGAEVEKLVLRDLKMAPCLEIYACKTPAAVRSRMISSASTTSCWGAKG